MENYLGKSGLPGPDIMLHYNGNCMDTYSDSSSLCFMPRTSQGKEVMKRHLWMEKKKSRIMVRNLKSKQ